MIQVVKNWLYDVITSSGILLRLFSIPMIKQMLMMLVFRPGESVTTVTDARGETMMVTKYRGKTFPAFGTTKIAGVKNVTVRKDDVMLCGYPKTGCHWVHEILHMLVTGKAEMTKHGKGLGGYTDLYPHVILDSLPSPRVINSHMLYEDLPQMIKERKTKIVLTVRNPKDTVVSYFNHVKNQDFLYHYQGTFDDYFKMYMDGIVDYGSYFDYYLNWDKVKGSQNDNPIFLVEYEKLKKNTLGTVKEIAAFLDIDISDDLARQIVETSDFKNMKAKRADNKLIRKGQVGDWRNWLSDDQSAEVNNMWKDRMQNCSYQPEFN